jgi:hypothetical protein
LIALIAGFNILEPFWRTVATQRLLKALTNYPNNAEKHANSLFNVKQFALANPGLTPQAMNQGPPTELLVI